MSEVVLSIEDISKQYRLGQVGRKSLNQDVNRWWHKMRGKEDPYLKIGEVNDRSKKGGSDYVWALQNVSFDVMRGEVLGIIGRNGAGKSTLLKILSKVTAPTTGKIKTKGRIAALLEVGTGFHPDLSGRDNIYLNGAILGMTKKEITSKFDEIVDFAGVERYIDTPVKRYSSGMYVRLAFAVAAHLEPDILIVDEVLAVGDAEFQKKCLGKMKDVSVNDGRTVLFVSHNMAAVQSLCTKAVILKNGTLNLISTTEKAIAHYINATDNASANKYNGPGTIKQATLLYSQPQLIYNTPVTIEVLFETVMPIKNVVLGIVIRDVYQVALLGINNRHYTTEILNKKEVTKGRIVVNISALPLMPGSYKIDLFLGDSTTDIQKVEDALSFTVEDSLLLNTATPLDYRLNKVLAKNVSWQLTS